VEIRAGRAGGTFVKRLGQDAVADSVSLLIRGRHIDMVRVLEARAAMEPSCAELAARHRSVAELVAIEEAIEAMATSRSLEGFVTGTVDWHVAVARVSGNEILGGFLQAVSRSVYAAAHNEGFVDEGCDTSPNVPAAASRMRSAIRTPHAARRRMARRLHAYAEALLA